MIKKKVKKVTYQIWEECEEEGCGGIVETDYEYSFTAFGKVRYMNVCRDCKNTQESLVKSPRIVEEYEEVLE